ncbi:gamma-aminobutyric acid type B receptor subunit 2-like isoform X2 [Hippocampus zosterae]|uniref:gamma-aminobutyric acid type B receptor subunit 2-like isoform X2 n=1 Tax=Hippocampus zosterae TaxID=109293 RepID=UPI00223D7788|nr:gamma-aminobutyric acid type B receptor subunit 2-like isoform X2 [Hippocampus zosterae]
MPFLWRRLKVLGFLLVLCGASTDSVPTPAVTGHPLPVLWMLPGPSGGGGANASAGLTLAVRMALEDLERQPAPLGDYRLQMEVIHTQCDLSSSLKSLFDAIWAGPKYLLLLGGACPAVATRLAGALPALRMVQVSYGNEASRLSGGKRHGNVFTLAPSGRAVNRAAVELLRRFGWTRVGLVAGESSAEMTEDLKSRMTMADVRLVSVTTLPDHNCTGLVDMKERDVRVVIVTLAQPEEGSLSPVFCCASRLKMFGAHHQWIVAGADPRWRPGFQAPGCTSDEIAAATDGAIWLPVMRAGRSDTPGVSGRTPEDFERAYLQKTRRHPGVRPGPRHALAYDAVWVAAKALSDLTEALKRRRKFSRNAEVTEDEAARALRDAVARTHFEGVTGTVSFQHGRRSSSVDVIQTQGSAGVLVGQLDMKTRELRVSERLLKFKASSAPKDGVEVRVERRRVSILIYGGLSAAATAMAAISLGVFCVVAGWRAREVPLLMLTAVFLSATSVIAGGPDDDFLGPETTRALCSLRACLLVASHSLASTSLLAQTWHHLSEGKVPSAYRLALVLTPVDALLLLAWQTLAPLGRVEMRHGPRGDSIHPDVITWITSQRCGGNDMDAWTAAIYAYKVPLVVCGCLLSLLLPDRHGASGGPCVWWCARVGTACVLWTSTWAATALPLISHNPSLDFCALNVVLLACDIIALAITLRGPLIDTNVKDGGVDVGGGAWEKLNWQLQLQSIELGQRQTGSSVTTSHDVTDSDVNSPELMRRRMSLQLPILHLSYLPAIGGVSASDSANFASWDAALTNT